MCIECAVGCRCIGCRFVGCRIVGCGYVGLVRSVGFNKLLVLSLILHCPLQGAEHNSKCYNTTTLFCFST